MTKLVKGNMEDRILIINSAEHFELKVVVNYK